jgi:hypothetical protein
MTDNTELRHEFECGRDEVLRMEKVRYFFHALRWVLCCFIAGGIISVVLALLIPSKVSSAFYFAMPALIALCAGLFSFRRFTIWRKDITRKLSERQIHLQGLSVITDKGMTALYRKDDSYVKLFECTWNQVAFLICLMGVCIIVQRNLRTVILYAHFVPKPAEFESQRAICRYFSPAYWTRIAFLRFFRISLWGVAIALCCGVMLGLAHLLSFLIFVLGARLLQVVQNWILH